MVARIVTNWRSPPGLLQQPILHLQQRLRQRPALEGRTVAQRPGFLLQCRHVVPGIEEGAIALEAANMLADDLALGHRHDPIGVGAQRYRLARVAAIDAVAVAIHVHQRARADPHLALDAALEPGGKRHQHGALGFLEHLPAGLVALLGVRDRLGNLDTAALEQLVQFGQILAAQPRGEHVLAHMADLILDLPLLPAGARRARHRLDQVVAGHLQELAVVLARLAAEDQLDRGLEVVVDPALAAAAP